MIRAVAEARATLETLVGEPLEAAEFSSAVEAGVRRVMDFDGWCLFGMDPVTGLRIAQFGGRGTDYTTDLARNEAVMTDVNGFRELSRRPVPAGWLSSDHPGAAHSFRFNEIIRPSGFRSELRFLLRDRAGVWGGLTLFSESTSKPYDDQALRRMSALADPLTRAVLRSPSAISHAEAMPRPWGSSRCRPNAASSRYPRALRPGSTTWCQAARTTRPRPRT
jgi:hypothetical protein